MTQKLTLHLGAVRASVRRGAIRGVGKAGEHLLGESRKLVPHEEGVLERSGVSQVDEADVSVTVYYDTPYAVAQHERLDYKHDEGRSAKYLERPMNSERSTMLALAAAEIRRELR